MKILAMDIETYEDYFCYCSILFDLDQSKFMDIKEIRRTCVQSADRLGSHIVNSKMLERINDDIADCDYYITYNGTSFDNHILAWLDATTAVRSVKTIEIAREANQIIDGNPEQLWTAKKGAITFARKDWRAKHFDILTCSLLRHSLKQWEMFANLPIRELPYKTNTRLNDKMRNDIKEYCFHDVWATAQVFLWKCVGDIKMRIKLMHDRFPTSLPYYFDLKAPKLSEAIVYKTRNSLPVKSNDPLSLFNLMDMDIPTDVKCIIACLATGDYTSDMAVACGMGYDKTAKRIYGEWKGIRYGVGGCHYMKQGKHVNLHERDARSLYPTIVRLLKLLKTHEALEEWSETMESRFAMKALKETDPANYDKCTDAGLKLVLNSLTGLFRLRQGSGPAVDPAVGVAMCLFGQCIITELANVVLENSPDDLVEVNTDSIFFTGDEELVAKVDAKAKEMYARYDTLFEPEETAIMYARDVNNYAVYDENGKFLTAKGSDASDNGYKQNEPAVTMELFNNLLKDKLELHWENYKWTDFIVKYHKSASAKYFCIGEAWANAIEEVEKWKNEVAIWDYYEPYMSKPKPKFTKTREEAMSNLKVAEDLLEKVEIKNKNYYFIWTTKECPKAVPIAFSRDMVDSKNGYIKARYGVYGFALEDIAYAKDYIDFSQYERDLYVNLDLWGRGDLVPRLSKLECKALKKKGLAQFFYETC